LRGHAPPRSTPYIQAIAQQGIAAIRAAGGGGRDLSEPIIDALREQLSDMHRTEE